VNQQKATIEKYTEVFTFTGELVSRLDTFHVWPGELPRG
jgi:hypothetical protein